MSTTNSVDYLLIGHVTADLQEDGGRLLGGTVSFSALVAKAFGIKVGILTSAKAGEPLLASLDSDVQVMTYHAPETTTFANIYGAKGRTQYVHGVAGALTIGHVPKGWLSAPLVHLAPLVNEVDPNIVFDFPDATILLTPQGWMRDWSDGGLVKFKRWFDRDVLEATDIMICSREDIKEAPELEQEFAEVVKHLIVTQGSKGGIYYHKGEAFRYHAVPTQETEPTGAGDVFAASFLSSLLSLDHNYKGALEVAAELAGISVTRIGLDTAPKPEEVKQALAKQQHKL